MSETTNLEKIKARILNLRRLAKGTHSIHEAEAAAKAASKYMAEFQISEAELVSRGEATAEDIDVEGEHIIYDTGRSTPWKAELAWKIAELNGLYCLKYHKSSAGRGSRYRVFGCKSDIEVALYMFQYLVGLIQELVDAAHPAGNIFVDDEGRLRNKRGVNPEKESWALGCVRGFVDKMNAERNAVLRSGSSGAMVLVSNKAKNAEEAYLNKNPEAKIGKAAASKAQRDHLAMSRGYAKGQTISVSPSLKS